MGLIPSIKNEGEFVVKENDEDDIGTTWKMNEYIVRGEKHIYKDFTQYLGEAWNQIMQIECRLSIKSSKKSKDFKQYSEIEQTLLGFNPNIVHGIRRLFSAAIDILKLTFGLKSIHKLTQSEAKQAIIKERIQNTLQHHHMSLNDSFFKYIFEIESSHKEGSEIPLLKTMYEALNAQFNEEASNYEKKRIKEIEKGDFNEDESLMEIFKVKQKILFDLIRSGKYIQNKDVQKHLISLITASQITLIHYHQLQINFESKRKVITENIINRHKIKSEVSEWMLSKVKKEFKPISLRMIAECNRNILKELRDNGLSSEIILFIRFVDLQSNNKQIFKENKSRIQKTNSLPKRIFEINQQLWPSQYKVVLENDNNGNVSYKQDTIGKTHLIPTDLVGWRFILFFTRFKVWTVNSFIYIFTYLLQSQQGIKALFCTETFYYKQIVDKETGEKKDGIQIYPYIVILKTVYNGMRKSLDDFESSPDRGIFGKNLVSRILKYIECYIFRFLILFVLLVGICIPIIIIINCLICITFALTSWFWILIILIIRQLFQILLFDFDTVFQIKMKTYNHKRNQFFEETIFFDIVPIIRIIIAIIIAFLEVIISIFSSLIIHPFLSLMYFIFAFIVLSLKTLRDAFMCFIISKIGRQPEQDSCFSWRIKGTGVTRQYTYIIDTEDAKFLMRGHLEKLELDEFEKRIEDKIQHPRLMYEDLVQMFLSNYQQTNLSKQLQTNQQNQLQADLYNSLIHNPIQEQLTIDKTSIHTSVENLLKQLKIQTSLRKENFPKLPKLNFKFTEFELQELFYQCEEMVRQFMEIRQMQWLFDKYEIDNQDFKLLTEKLIIEIFEDENILFPINELDKRVEIQTSRQQKFDEFDKSYKKGGKKTSSEPITQLKFKKLQKFKKVELFPFVGASDVYQNAVEAAILKQINFEPLKDPGTFCFYFSHSDFLKASKNVDDSNDPSFNQNIKNPLLSNFDHISISL